MIWQHCSVLDMDCMLWLQEMVRRTTDWLSTPLHSWQTIRTVWQSISIRRIIRMISSRRLAWWMSTVSLWKHRLKCLKDLDSRAEEKQINSKDGICCVQTMVLPSFQNISTPSLHWKWSSMWIWIHTECLSVPWQRLVWWMIKKRWHTLTIRNM